MALGSATGVLVRGDRDAGRRRPCDDGGGDVGDGAATPEARRVSRQVSEGAWPRHRAFRD